MEVLGRRWAWLVAAGVTALLAGLLSVALADAVAPLIALVGGLVLAAGGVHLLAALLTRSWRGGLMWVLVGVLRVAVGLLFLLAPAMWAKLGDGAYRGTGLHALRSLPVAFPVALFLVVEGIFLFLLAFQARPAAGWRWFLEDACAALLFGGVVLFLAQSPWILGLLFGSRLLCGGWAMLMFATAVRAQVS